MNKGKIVLVLTLTLMLMGCNKVNKTTSTQNNEEVKVEENSNSLKYEICSKYNIPVQDNRNYITNLEARNKAILDEYIRAVSIVKEFSSKNLLELKYVQPISDKIASIPQSVNAELYKLYNDLGTNGAETIHYFTDEEKLNVELRIGIADAMNKEKDEHTSFGITYSDVIYKAAIENIDDSFEFKNSKLDEFRKMILPDEDIDYDRLNDYIKKINIGEYNKDTVFLNKIDENKVEIIRVEKGNCYYRLVFNPLL